MHNERVLVSGGVGDDAADTGDGRRDTDQRTFWMKICFISSSESIHMIRWARYFAEKGDDVTIISPPFGETIIPSVKIARLRLNPFYYKSHLVQMAELFLNALEIRYKLSRLKPDIVHIHSLDYIHPLMMAVVFSLFGGSRNLIVSTWGSDILGGGDSHRSKWDLFCKRAFLKQAAEINSSSLFLARATEKILRQRNRVDVIPLGVDCEIFKPREGRKKQKSRVTIGFVKHLRPKYGPEYLIRAFAEIARKYRQVELLMAGTGAMEEFLRNMVKTLHLENSIHFLGNVPHEKVPDLLTDIDIFVMPSQSESFGVAAAEAQAMEIPVVASRVGGVPEVVVDGKTGFLVEPKDIDGFVRAISRLIEDPALREEMGKEGRKHVLEHFEWGRCAAKMAKVYLSVYFSLIGKETER